MAIGFRPAEWHVHTRLIVETGRRDCQPAGTGVFRGSKSTTPSGSSFREPEMAGQLGDRFGADAADSLKVFRTPENRARAALKARPALPEFHDTLGQHLTNTGEARQIAPTGGIRVDPRFDVPRPDDGLSRFLRRQPGDLRVRADSRTDRRTAGPAGQTEHKYNGEEGIDDRVAARKRSQKPPKPR
jgi:hypothetical protein